MKGFSMPSISIPKISIPSIPINTKIDAGTIKNAISSAIPDISNVTDGLNIEELASQMLSDAMKEGIELPPELGDLIK